MDELLCQSLLLFRQYRFYDAPECGEKAFRILEEAHVWMGRTQECVDMAKWGCVIECLAQKYYIEDDTDAILEEIDAALVAHWKRIEKIHAEVTTVYLWLGYYFLLRFRNRESRSHSRCKQIMSSLLCALVEIFRKVEKGGAPTEVLSHLSVDVWGETVCWMEQVHDSRLCEKQSSALLSFIISASTLPPTSCIPLFIGITSAVEATQKGGSNFCFHSGNTPKSKLISCLLVY